MEWVNVTKIHAEIVISFLTNSIELSGQFFAQKANPTPKSASVSILREENTVCKPNLV